MLEEQVQSPCLFISYDNINFYEKIYDPRLYNKAYLVNYTAGYIYFMHNPDKNPVSYINNNQMQLEVLNSLIADDFLLDQVGSNH